MNKSKLIMDIITWTAIAMLAIGGIGAAYVTWSFRQQTKSYQEDLKRLSKETIELSKLTQKLITGGDSYAIIDRQIADYGDVKKTEFYLKLVGDYPLRDLNVKITDITGLNIASYKKRLETKTKGLTSKEKSDFIYNIHYPVLLSFREYQIDQEIIDKIFKKDRRDIVIQFDIESELCEVLQREKIYDVWGEYICGTRIQYTNGEEVEVVDDGFPKDSQGRNFWGIDKSEFITKKGMTN